MKTTLYKVYRKIKFKNTIFKKEFKQFLNKNEAEKYYKKLIEDFPGEDIIIEEFNYKSKNIESGWV